MKRAPLPPNESQRLATLREYNILDTPPEDAFDDLTLLASQICQTPMAMVSLVDEKRQWFKSKIGIDASETSRDIAFCAHTILNVKDVLEVDDACADPRFADSPLVTSGPHIRFYAGAPLVSPDGQALGALCVMDRKPHKLTPDQLNALRALGRNVVAQLDLRKQARALAMEVAEHRRTELLRQEQLKLLTASQKEAGRLLALGEKSRRALLSVLEDEKRTGDDLRNSEELFRMLAENIREVFWIIDPNKKSILYVSPAYEIVWGRTCQSLYDSPTTWLTAIHPDDQERVLTATTKQEAGTYDEEYRIIHPDGAVRWIHDCAYPVRNARGEVYRIVGVAEDITERKRTQEELTSKTAILEAQLESSLDGILVVDMKAKVVLQNKRYTEIFKVPPELVANNENFKLRQWVACRTKNPSETIAEIENLFTHPEEIGRSELALVDGTILDAYSAPIRDHHGKVYGRIYTYRDITERKQIQEELKSKTAFLESQVESTLDGLLVVNGQAKVLLKNKRLGEIFKVPSEIFEDDDDAKMRNWVTSRMKHPEEFDRKVSELYANPDRVSRDELTLIDGTILDRYSAPVRDGDETIYGRIWAFRDITERRKLEMQFLQSQKMEGIGQLAGGVAHDFNNILAIIQMQTSLLKNGNDISRQQAEHIDEISTTVQRAAALTRQLLLFSRREVFQPRNLDLNESVTNTTKMLRRIVRENIQIEIKLASQPLLVHADPGMIDQVLMNLTVNARDAMSHGGSLTIETAAAELSDADIVKFSHARAGSFVCLSISDTGTGIPPEVLPRIFEPFFTTKETGKGTGLGLATVFGITQQHQGWVDVQTEVGRGTTFRVYLPRLLGRKINKPAQLALKDMRGGNETLLLAEDDPSLRAGVRKALGQLGYRILEAPTGSKALEVWKENRNEIGLLLTDLVMPGGTNGKELAQTLLKENPSLKVIYMSGYSSEVAGTDLQLKEGVNFLPKPFRAAQLAEIIRHLLDKSVSPEIFK
jgi:two-component system cell cycle sensor histidine kinase/response regulator CckA